MDALWKLNLENTRKSEESLKANPRATLAAKGLTKLSAPYSNLDISTLSTKQFFYRKRTHWSC